MIFRLFVKMPDEGWVLVCSVDSHDAVQALDEAKLMLKPQHLGKPTKLLPGDLPPPSETDKFDNPFPRL